MEQTNTQPTPGPWTPGLSVEGDLCIYTADAEGRVGGEPVAVVCQEAGGNELPYLENAQLLAAAPELLAALRAYVAMTYAPSAIVDMAVQAIQKAISVEVEHV